MWTGPSPTPTVRVPFRRPPPLRSPARHERWLRRCTVELEGIGRFEGTDIRFGPFPRLLSNPKSYETELIGNASWIWVRGIKGDKRTITVEL